MKPISNFRYFIAFGSFLLFGFWSGQKATYHTMDLLSINLLEKSSPRLQKGFLVASQQGNFPLPVMENLISQNADVIIFPNENEIVFEQENILLLIVDNLQVDNPQLSGAWIVMTINGSSRWVMMPVYPSPDGGIESELSNVKLKTKFNIHRNAPTSEFLAFLHSKNLWWDHYLIIDQSIVNAVLANTALLADYQSLYNSATESNSQSYQFMNQSTDSQMSILRELCYRGSIQQGKLDWQIMTAYLDHHLVSDFNFSERVKIWNTSPVTLPGIYCEFPLYDIQ